MKKIFKGNFGKLIKGTLISFIISIICLLLISVILTYTDVSESILTVTVICISAISILTGSIISALNINKNGILNGCAVGAIYMITIYLLSSAAIAGFSLNLQSIIMIFVSIIAGMIGGIIGVNFHK